jgi:hypothetical protein
LGAAVSAAIQHTFAVGHSTAETDSTPVGNDTARQLRRPDGVKELSSRRGAP